MTPDLGMQHRHEEAFRKLTMNEEGAIEHDLGLRIDISGGRLDPHTCAIARISALVAMGAAPASFQWAGSTALSAGVTPEELIAALTAIAPIVGMARVVAAAPELALAIGYDIDAAFEVLFEPEDQSLGSGSAEGVGAVGPDATEEREVSMGPRSCRTP